MFRSFVPLQNELKSKVYAHFAYVILGQSKQNMHDIKFKKSKID